MKHGEDEKDPNETYRWVPAAFDVVWLVDEVRENPTGCLTIETHSETPREEDPRWAGHEEVLPPMLSRHPRMVMAGQGEHWQ